MIRNAFFDNHRCPRPRVPVFVAVGTLLLLCLSAASCRREKAPRRKRPACGAKLVQDTRAWLRELCQAREKTARTNASHWWGLPLAEGSVEPVQSLPPGVLVTLTPRRLLINGLPAPDWPKPPGWIPPVLHRSPRQVLSRLVSKLRKTLNADAKTAAAAAQALQDLSDRAGTDAAGGSPQPRRGPRRAPEDPVPSGLTVLTLVTAKLRQTGRGPRIVHLAIGPDVPVRRVVELLPLIVLAGFDGVNLLFRPRSAPEPPSPPDPQLHRALGILGPEGDARIAHTARRRALDEEERRWSDAGCAALSRLRAELAKTAPPEQCRVLVERLPEALQACRCVRDEKVLLTLWQAVLGPYDYVGIWTGQLHPRTTPVVAPTNARWIDIAERVSTQSRRTFWLELKDHRHR
ncbi:MAG: hypothetical protein ABI333_16100 [bacterium]